MVPVPLQIHSPHLLGAPENVMPSSTVLLLLLECSLESSSWHGCWRVCGDQHLLLKWQQLQALHQDELPGPQEDEPHAGRLGLLLPMSFNLLTLLQAVLRAILAIR